MWGELGNGSPNLKSNVPVTISLTNVPSPSSFIALAGSKAGYHFCGLTGNGAAYCWGSDELGEAGNGAVAPDQGGFFNNDDSSFAPLPVDISAGL